jgi:nucleoside-diphosphate-sugar epimerase
MRALVIGATGYVGSAVARNFKAHGYETHGQARNPQNVAALEAAGITPIHGDLDDLAHLAALSKAYDLTVLAGVGQRDQEAAAVSAFIEACRGSHRRFIYTSGTGVLGVESHDGRWSDYAFEEDDPFPFPGSFSRTWRIETENLVRQAGREGVHAMVLRPPLIYGHGGSVQVPAIFQSVRKTGKACYVGRGLNLYSNVHVDDLAEAYRLAAEKGAPGALYHTVGGEADFRSIAEAVAVVMGCETRSVTFEEGCEIWGELVTGAALAVNSRSVPRRTRDELGWEPREIDLIEDIRNGSYRARYAGAIPTSNR